MRNREMTALVGAVLLGLVVGCGEVFVAGPGTGGSGGSGAGPAGGGGAGGAQGGTSGVGAAGGGGPACAEPAASNVCEQCLFESCEDPYCDCANEPQCTGIGACLAMGKPRDYCLQLNKDGISLAGKVQVCANEKCHDECGYPVVEECLACEYESCPDEVNACFALGDCLAFFKCFDDCKMAGGADLTCSEQCYSEHTMGSGAAGDLIECAKGPCGEACAP